MRHSKKALKAQYDAHLKAMEKKNLITRMKVEDRNSNGTYGVEFIWGDGLKTFVNVTEAIANKLK